MSEWQPIETAPRTSKSILVWCPERKNTYTVSWDGRYGGEWLIFGAHQWLTQEPTHWMPLPEPPK